MKACSGKLQLRMDPRVHVILAKASARKGRSINQLINQYIQEGLEREQDRGEKLIRMLDSLPRISTKVHIAREDAYAEE